MYVCVFVWRAGERERRGMEEDVSEKDGLEEDGSEKVSMRMAAFRWLELRVRDEAWNEEGEKRVRDTTSVALVGRQRRLFSDEKATVCFRSSEYG